jgi:hypothetical protein
MTDRRELETLLRRARAKGARIRVTRDAEGGLDTFQVTGLKGVGPYPMGPIGFAERMREVLGPRRRR